MPAPAIPLRLRLGRIMCIS